MCLFITGTLPKGTDPAIARSVAHPRGHAMAWSPLRNEAVETQLPSGLLYYRITADTCDCGSGLRKLADENGQKRTRPRRQKLDRRRRDAKRVTQGSVAADGDLLGWYYYMCRIAEVVRGPAGLLVHWYGGPLEDEDFRVATPNPLPVESMGLAEFPGFAMDTLQQFIAKSG